MLSGAVRPVFRASRVSLSALSNPQTARTVRLMARRHTGEQMPPCGATPRAAATAYGRQMAKRVGAKPRALVANTAFAPLAKRWAFGNRQTRVADKTMAGNTGILSRCRTQIGVPPRLSMNRSVPH